MNMNRKAYQYSFINTYFFLRNLLIKHIDLVRITATETQVRNDKQFYYTMCSLIPMRPLAFFFSSYFLPALFFSKLGVFPIKGMGGTRANCYLCMHIPMGSNQI